MNINLKAEILIEALPYIQKYSGKTIVIKYGGNAMIRSDLKYFFAQDITLLKQVGINPVIVHGGGPQIGEMLNNLKIQSSFYEGLRVTSAEAMEVVEMVLSGKVNKEIVGNITKAGGKAVGISGRDASFIIAKKILSKQDLGFVGEITQVNPRILEDLKGFIPVISPIATDENGTSFNINADIAAAKIASSIKADKLLMLTDVSGVLDSEKKHISSITFSGIKELEKEGIITGGMLPKLKGAIDALKAGVNKIHIIDGTIRHGMILELFTDSGIGTEITND